MQYVPRTRLGDPLMQHQRYGGSCETSTTRPTWFCKESLSFFTTTNNGLKIAQEFLDALDPDLLVQIPREHIPD